MHAFRWFCIVLAGSFVSTVLAADEWPKAERTNEDIRIRDPFVLTDAQEGVYYLYAQMKNRDANGPYGVDVYRSRDLTHWTDPIPVLSLPDDRGIKGVWAPEVHRLGEAYYFFVTLTFDEPLPDPKPVTDNWPDLVRRGTWIFRSERPTGPFEPLRNSSHTPAEWSALDGTLWIEDQRPYMVFCHEWTQIKDGTIDYVQLSNDLLQPIGQPKTILHASSVPAVAQAKWPGKVTDGPFLYRSPHSDALFMIWSSILPKTGYCVLFTRSESGKLAGPWSDSAPVFPKNGGHGMIFQDLSGQLCLAIHQPNSGAPERFRYFQLIDDGTSLQYGEINR